MVGKSRLGQVLNFWLKWEDGKESLIMNSISWSETFTLTKVGGLSSMDFPLFQVADLPNLFQIFLPRLPIHGCATREKSNECLTSHGEGCEKTFKQGEKENLLASPDIHQRLNFIKYYTNRSTNPYQSVLSYCA